MAAKRRGEESAVRDKEGKQASEMVGRACVDKQVSPEAAAQAGPSQKELGGRAGSGGGGEGGQHPAAESL